MRRIIFALLLSLFVNPIGLIAADSLFITEFMAVNTGPLTDEEGDFSDWIEVHNAGTNVVNLDGWYLTDKASDLRQWRFPATNMPANSYLVVFASSKDRRVPGAPLHTNFRLGSEGEFLALVKPDGVTIAWAYAPAYPGQVNVASFGLPVEQVQTTLVTAGATARVLVPTDGTLGTAWTGPTFNDSFWNLLPTGVGYETDTAGSFVPATIANSVTEFSGVQGQNSWQYGYWDVKGDADGKYAPTEFVPFPSAGGSFGPNNYWDGTSWDWFNGDPPNTQITPQGGRPAGDNGSPSRDTHWAVRRYINEHNGPISISGRITHTSDWVYVTATGVFPTGVAPLLYVYLTDVGEGYVDDVKLVVGEDAEVGPNLVVNGDFETQNLNPSWTVSPNLAGSATTTAVRKVGTRSLRLVATGGGASQSTSIYQSISPAPVAGQLYTLSYWYLPPAVNAAQLVIRFSGSWIETSPTFCGDGVVARIFVDGNEVLTQAAYVNTTDYTITVPASLGSKVDFALDPGSSSDDDCDGALFTSVIQSADPNTVVVADSLKDWSTTGQQGENNWFYGYRNSGTVVPPPAYNAGMFTPFPRSGTPFGPGNYWTGREWDWWNGDPPFDEIGDRLMSVNGNNSANVHWTIRRWVSEVSGQITVDWSLIKLAAEGSGVTARVFHNGVQRDSVTVPGTNAPVIRRSAAISGVQVGDFIDIVLDPVGTSGSYSDIGDPCLVTAVIRGGPTLTRQIASNIQAGMQSVNASAYLRIPFDVSDPASVQFLNLRMKYDDGFVAWLNGVQVASDNAPMDPLWNSTATSPRSDADASEFVTFNLSASRGLLRPGNNVLAVQGLNASAGDSDFLILPELVASRLDLTTNVTRYFSVQTPGGPNGAGQSTLGPIIVSAEHTPNVPTDAQDMVVTAPLVSSFRPIASVRLFYRVQYGSEAETPMFDDGQHQDGAAGDGIYAGVIPNAASTPGQMVRYYIFATDDQGSNSRFPAFTDPQNSPQYQGTVVMNPGLTNALPVLHMFVQNPVLATNYTGTRCSLFYDEEFYDNVAVNLHGQTTASVFAKRSMDIDFNRGYTFRWRRGEERVNDLVLLTTAADKAFIRQPLAYETFGNVGVPTHFCVPIRVQQNNSFFGVFTLTEKGDDNFLERVGLDGNGALYKVYLPLTNAYGGVAEKKTRQNEPNDDLAALINGVNPNQSLSALRQYVYDNVDVPEFINFLAGIQLVQNEDCCWYKNYYLYRDTLGNREWQILPWDLDLTFGRTFEPWVIINGQLAGGYYSTNIYAVNRYYNQLRSSYGYIGIDMPVVNALFTLPETYDMFFRRWTSVQLEFLRTNNTHPLLLRLERRVDELASQTRSDAALDLAKWGTYAPSQTMDVAITALKNDYFARRRDWIFNTLSFNNGGPYLGIPPANVAVRLGLIEYNPSGNQAQEYIQITNANTFSVDVSGWKLSGGVEHTFKPGTVIPARSALYLSPDVNSFRARTSGPRGGLGLFVQGNYSGQLSAWGESLAITDPNGRSVAATNYPVDPSLLQRYLRITEIMYNPSPLTGNPTDPQQYEYIELKNVGPSTLNLTGAAFSSGVEFQFPGGASASLAPGQSVLVVRNLAAFSARYGAGLNVAGQFVGSLDNAGEVLRLDDASGEKILEFAYENKWYPITDGFGFSLVAVNEATPWENWGLPSNWRASGSLNGSPGQPNTTPPAIIAVRVNEVLSASTPPAVDAVELYNPTVVPANIGGWYLTDDFRTPRKYRFPVNTTVPASGYLVVTEAQFNPTNPPTVNSFAFGSDGDEAWLFSADAAGNLTGYQHGFGFGAIEPGVTFGRHVISNGEEHFVAQTANTLSAINPAPRVGPLVISEIHYHPVTLTGTDDNSDDEFVEIRNITGATVPLFDPLNPNNRWQLSGGISLVFPAGLTLEGGSSLLALNFNPTNTARMQTFRNRFFVPNGTIFVGPFDGKLDNSADTVALFKPGIPIVGVAPYILIDEISYQDQSPWPALADGTGASLQRRVPGSYGNDSANWAAGRPTPGQARPTGTLPVITRQPFNVVTGATMIAAFSLEATGTAPLSYQWSFEGETIPGATNSTLLIPNVQFNQQGSYSAVVFNGLGAVTSSNATLTLVLPPYFSIIPTNVLVRVRPDPAAAFTTNAAFAFQARGQGTLRYQWRFKGEPIPGATGPTLIINNVQVTNGGEYTVAVTDNIGTIFSPPAFLYPLVTPSFVQQPIGRVVGVGSTITLSASVTGSPAPFTYEWRRGVLILGTATSDSTNTFFTTTAPAIAGNNLYRVVVRNMASTTNGVISANAVVVTVADTDSDGLPDNWEAQYGLNPFDNTDRNQDTDGDGSLNWEEFEAGTDPVDPSSYLRIDSITAGGSATLVFGSVSGRSYTVEYKDDLEGSQWRKLTDVPARQDNGFEQVVDPAFAASRYYRLITPRQP